MDEEDNTSNVLAKDYHDGLACKLLWTCTVLMLFVTVSLLIVLIVVAILSRVCGNEQSVKMENVCDYL